MESYHLVNLGKCAPISLEEQLTMVRHNLNVRQHQLYNYFFGFQKYDLWVLCGHSS